MTTELRTLEVPFCGFNESYLNQAKDDEEVAIAESLGKPHEDFDRYAMVSPAKEHQCLAMVYFDVLIQDYDDNPLTDYIYDCFEINNYVTVKEDNA